MDEDEAGAAVASEGAGGVEADLGAAAVRAALALVDV